MILNACLEVYSIKLFVGGGGGGGCVLTPHEEIISEH